jgi:hypothetical protein
LKTKAYIAVFLTFIFLAKFATKDADGLNLLFSGSDISFVNPHCKTENPPKKTKKTADFSQANDLLASRVITLNGFCTSQFQFETFNDQISFTETNYQKHNDHTESIISTFQDKFYPPPKV